MNNKIIKKICIDLRPLETSNKYRGFGYYIYNLVKQIAQIDKANQYTFLVYSNDNPVIPIIRNLPNYSLFKIKKPKIRPRFWWIFDQISIPKAVYKIKPDIYISLDMNMPLLLTFQKKVKTINMVYDLILIVMKKEYNFPIDKKIEFKLKFMASKKVDKVLTISNFSKADLIKYLKIPQDKIDVVYGAIDEEFKPITQQEKNKIKSKFANNKNFFLVAGDYYGLDPRKNYEFIVECFNKLVKNPKFKNHAIVFAGKCGGIDNDYSKILNQAKKFNIKDKVIFTDFVSQEILIKLLASAEILLYPTKYEGFGLPPLQAMACGTPVLTSDNTSLPEVCQNAAVMIKNTDNMKEFIKGVEYLTDHRDIYIKRGLLNNKRFSWSNSAQVLLSVVNKL